MNKSVILKVSFIILFAFIVFIIGNAPEKPVWASALHQTVPTLTPTTEGEPTEEPDEGDGWPAIFGETLRENLGCIIGLGFCILISGGILGGLIAWWIVRRGDEDEEEEEIGEGDMEA